jgi:hypothetical protein
MNRPKSLVIAIAMLLLIAGMAFRLSTVRGQDPVTPPTPEQQEEVCMQDAALDFVVCKKAAADETQRQQCRDFFKCRRDACAAIRNGEGAKHCKPPFTF